MGRLVISDDARDDVDEIATRIGLDKPMAALRWADQIAERFEMLADWPGAGPKRDDLASGLRSFPHGNYLIFYRATDVGVIVVRVIDGRRHLHSRMFA